MEKGQSSILQLAFTTETSTKSYYSHSWPTVWIDALTKEYSIQSSMALSDNHHLEQLVDTTTIWPSGAAAQNLGTSKTLRFDLWRDAKQRSSSHLHMIYWFKPLLLKIMGKLDSFTIFSIQGWNETVQRMNMHKKLDKSAFKVQRKETTTLCNISRETWATQIHRELMAKRFI